MDPEQRFKLDRPCPVCGGHEGLPHREGRRCFGFLGESEEYAHCTREEYSGDLQRNANSGTYSHRLQGFCRCGKEHAAASSRLVSTANYAQSTRSLDSYRDPNLGKPDQLWSYCHADRKIAGHIARWDKSGDDKIIRPLAFVDGQWRQKGIPSPRPVYNLQALLESPNSLVLVVEGEKTCDAASTLVPTHVPITSMGGAKAAHLTDWSPCKGRQVVVWPDNDPDGRLYAREVSALVLKAGASSARIVQLPEGMPAHWDLANPLPCGVDVQNLLADAKPVVAEVGELDASGQGDGQRHSLSSGDRLLKWAIATSDLFCDGEETYADVWIDGRRESLPISSKSCRRWLRLLYWEREGKGATREALTHAAENLDAIAARAEQRGVYQRIASHLGKIYVDLCDNSRHVVAIDSQGWRVLNEPPPVRFRRPKSARPIPEPVRVDASKGLSSLHRFLNVNEDDFRLCVAWLLASLRDKGPYPLLVLTGEQGSAKSTAAKILRSVVDPAYPPSTGMPKNERDAVIATRNRHVLAYDNLSRLPPWLSDTLCRISTGEGFTTRALYTDTEEVVIEASRPIILTGIENPSVRGDLADRSLTIRLDPISETNRRTESELMEDFERVRPSIFGALLDGLSEGLRKQGLVSLDRVPRMADFFEWAVSCENAYWPKGTFKAAYDDSIASAIEDVVEDSPIGPALRQLLEETQGSNGTATELLACLNARRQEEKAPKAWPITGAVMGKQLTRLAPSLRKLGYTFEMRRTKQGNVWQLEPPQ